MDHDRQLSPETLREIANDCICLRLQRAGRSIGRSFDDAVRPLGLTSWQFSLLAALAGPEAPTVNGLSETLGLDRTTTSKNLRPLERRGYVQIRTDGRDSRARRVVLTNAGKSVLLDAVPSWREVNAAVASQFSPEELTILRSCLDSLARLPS